MPQIEITKNTTSKDVTVRFISTVSGQPDEGVTVDTPGLEFWYRRDKGDKVPFTPIALDSITADYVEGGLIAIDNGYYRLDIPDAAIAIGIDEVQIGGGADDLLMIGVSIRLADSRTTAQALGSDTSSPELVDCSVMLPEAPASTAEGCVIRTKRRHIPVNKGVVGTAVWIMRKSNGMAANFTACLAGSDSVSEEDDMVVKVRFQGCDRSCIIAEVDGVVQDSDHGIIEFEIPLSVSSNAGVYFFQAALMNGDSPVFMDGGLISVEHGMWGDTSHMNGPPTIQDIRFATQDRQEANVLLRAYEYDDADILEAIRWPVAQFNETPPDLGRRFTCNNFPYRYHWIQAVVGRLMTAAAQHYVRNKMQAASGGMTVDDKNKDSDYLRFAQLYLQEWKEFLILKKVELNARQAFGSLGSGYSRGGW